MTNLTSFNYLTNSIRVVDIDGEPWFVASDICRALALTSTTVSVQSLDADEWSKKNLGLRGMGAAIVVSEPGLYKMIGRSNKPEAKKFDRWVRHDVLPSIRKDGGYIQGEEKVKTGEMDEEEFFARALVMADRKLKRLKDENAQLTKRLTEITLQDWKGQHRLHLTTSQTGKLAYIVKRVYAEEGITPLGKVPASVNLPDGRVIETELKLYHKELLDKAARRLSLI